MSNSKALNIDLWHASKRFCESRTNAHTRRAYCQQLIKFVGWIVTKGHSPTLKSLNPLLVTAYRDSELVRGAAPATVALNIKVLRKLDMWLQKQINWTPRLTEVKPPNVPLPEFKGVSEERRQQLIQAALDSERDFESLRLSTLLYCYAGLGLRREEPLLILPSQLISDYSAITSVKMKGCIYRSKVIPEAHRSLFSDYSTARRRFLSRKKAHNLTLPLILSDKLKPLNPRTAGRWVEQFDTTPHELRHSCAHAILNKTGNLRLVAYELGQTGMATAMHYTAPSYDSRQIYHQELYEG